MQTIQILYRFKLPDETVDDFYISLNATTLGLQMERYVFLPPWTELSFHKCPNCTLSEEEETYCPVAGCLARIVHKFSHLLSYDKVMLEVKTRERDISQETTVQRAIASYMGLVMATCGCPHTEFLRPMARFHLPLASEEETIYRAISMYALAQHFVGQQGGRLDNDFKGLEQKYRNLQLINETILGRLQAASDTDSSVNGLLNLDVYARAMPYVIEDKIDELKYLFTSYLQSFE